MKPADETILVSLFLVLCVVCLMSLTAVNQDKFVDVHGRAIIKDRQVRGIKVTNGDYSIISGNVVYDNKNANEGKPIVERGAK